MYKQCLTENKKFKDYCIKISRGLTWFFFEKLSGLSYAKPVEKISVLNM